jgi:lipid-A-disaccharide synthase-like uncharacterized protein
MINSMLNSFAKIVNIDLWIIFGFIAQFVFFMRFIVQWWSSEKAKKTVVPNLFWYLSMAGTTMIFFYSLKRKDIVFISASCLNFFLYLRNLIIAKKAEKSINSKFND